MPNSKSRAKVRRRDDVANRLDVDGRAGVTRRESLRGIGGACGQLTVPTVAEIGLQLLAEEEIVALDCCRCSSAHCCWAASSKRRFSMHVSCCEVVRARTKLGMAIAAKRPIIATTIIISTSVNPCFLEVNFFMTPFYIHGMNNCKERVK